MTLSVESSVREGLDDLLELRVLDVESWDDRHAGVKFAMPFVENGDLYMDVCWDRLGEDDSEDLGTFLLTVVSVVCTYVTRLDDAEEDRLLACAEMLDFFVE